MAEEKKYGYDINYVVSGMVPIHVTDDDIEQAKYECGPYQN